MKRRDLFGMLGGLVAAALVPKAAKAEPQMVIDGATFGEEGVKLHGIPNAQITNCTFTSSAAIPVYMNGEVYHLPLYPPLETP